MNGSPGKESASSERSLQWLNAVMRFLLYTPGIQRVLGRSLAVLLITGRKTGRRYSIPVSYSRHGDDVIILTSASRLWWRNLKANPNVRIRLAGRTYRGTATAKVATESDLPTLTVFLTGRKVDAKAHGVRLDSDGRPDEDDIRAVLPDTVLIRVSVVARVRDARRLPVRAVPIAPNPAARPAGTQAATRQG